MEVPTAGKSPNTSLSFRYTANNEEIEELFNACEDDPPTPQCDPPSTVPSENASPKKGDRTPSIIDKYFKSIRAEKPIEKEKDEFKVTDKPVEESRSSSTPKEITSSPMKEYLNRLGKRSTPEVNESRESSNETWKIFHDFKFKIAQAVEDMKTRSLEETKEGKEKSVPRENSMSDSEENSAVKDVDQQSVGDTDNQVSSLDSSMQNLSDITQPLTAKATERELSLPVDTKNHSDSSDDTHKNLVYSEMADRDFNLTDNMLEVESGVEALEDTMDGFGDVTNPQPIIAEDNKTDTPSDKPSTPIPSNFNLPPSNSNLKKPEKKPKKEKKYFLNFTMYFLTFLLVVNFLLFRNSNAWNGFLLGVWFFSLFSDFKSWVMDNYFGNWEPRKGSFLQEKSNYSPPVTYTIPSVKEHMPMKKYEGWINHYRSPEYDPYNYHINKTTTAFVKLEGCNLRISYTKTKVAKRALWDEKIEHVSFYQHRLYNLTGARVILLPKGLVKRRQWSKKYPICVILSDKENIQVLEKETLPQTDKRPSEVTTIGDKKKEQESESTETSASPEKKKKSVWRRREKSVSVTPVPHVEGEPGKEGLRHRLVRKMHRDKKSEILSTVEPEAATSCACPEEAEVKERPKDSDDELDDHEITRIRECLEEAEWDTGEDPVDGSEWSVHIKNTTEKHSHLFLFARTGRDKHEWFRRLNTAVAEANVGSAESSTSAEDKPPEPEADKKDGIEIAAYKFTEKDTVAFAKSYNKSTESISEGVLFNNLSMSPLPTDSDMYEKNFWPYLINILQSHEMTLKQTADIGVNCQLEPSPHERQKNKKKKKVPSKSSSPPCPCRALPADVTWLNSALARVFYDLMRDPQMIARLQNRIQRKLNTLKLPSFMSPLVVEELSLAGACPLVARVLPAGADARGVWLDADLRYAGGAYITLLTQINLMKLKEKNLTLEEQLLTATDNIVENDMNVSSTCGIFSEKQLRKNKPAIFDSDVEDSAESSSDDDTHPLQPVDSTESTHVSEAASTMTTATEGGSSKKKFLRMVDKIATNKYFQQVTDYKYIKRAMEGLSNTDIKLHLEVQGLEGRLAFNLPPPPHDRLWIGFRTNPQLVLKARPAVGARMLRFAHISNWIEQKLSKEFEKVLVLPNMEDFIIDVMTPTPVNFE